MCFKISALIIIFIFVFNQSYGQNNFKTERTVKQGRYGMTYSWTVNKSQEYIVEYRNNTEIYPTRVTITSDSAERNYPILIVAQQQKIITSWQLPMVVDPFKDGNDLHITAHTLCPETMQMFQTVATQIATRKSLTPEQCSNPTISVKTLSPVNVMFHLQVDIVKDFFVNSGTEYDIKVTQSQPVYYYYNFHDIENSLDDSDAVLITATSESDTCMLFSIQKSGCPVLDLENNMKYNSYWQTMSKKSAIVITKFHYPHGFFIVMVVKNDNLECSETNNPASNFLTERRKQIKLKITPTITLKQHNQTAYITLGIFAGLLLLAVLAGIFYFIKVLRRIRRMSVNDESSINMIEGRENIRWTNLCVFSCSSTNRSATNYVWLVVIVVLFYILPVLQVAVTYQGIVNETGNDDICYYNFLCALPHRFGIHITDFNHVLSNIGYVFLGIIFIILTYLKGVRECTRTKEGFGIFKPYGMYYALGISLIMEGVMSACYHICPKKSNFQFDTSFMYVMTVLMIVNVYESRQSDMSERERDERGYLVFFVLAGVTAISVIGSYSGTNEPFWIIFTIIHILSCLVITWQLEQSFIKSVITKESRLKMNYVDICHGVLLIIGNGVNIALATFGYIEKYSFATHVLTVLITNGVLYTMFYIFMKVLFKEKIVIATPILIVLSLICWVPALYFFLTTVTTWEQSPAESRNLNRECMLVEYYDSHDIWHFLSAFALFFTCWILLTLDEGLHEVPTGDITDFHGQRR